MNENWTERKHGDILLPFALCFAVAHVAGAVGAVSGYLSHSTFLVFIALSITVPTAAFFFVPSLSTRKKRVICGIALAAPLILPVVFLVYMLYVFIFVAPNMY